MWNGGEGMWGNSLSIGWSFVRVSRLYKHTPIVAFFKVAEGKSASMKKSKSHQSFHSDYKD
jgi:hypothetical protein